MTSVSVRYSTATGSSTIEGSVRLIVEPDTDWQREWSIAYAQLKTTVDAAANASPTEPAPIQAAPEGPDEPTAEAGEPDSSDATTEVSQTAPIFEVGAPVEYTGCRVMFNANEYPAQGKRREHVRMRIGNQDQIHVGSPPGYVNAKAYEPDIMDTFRLLRQGDIVDIKGSFEPPWTKRNRDGSSQQEYDLVVTEISRA